ETRILTHTCTHKLTHSHTHTHPQPHKHTYTHTHTHNHTNTQTQHTPKHKPTHTNTQTHRHTHTLKIYSQLTEEYREIQYFSKHVCSNMYVFVFVCVCVSVCVCVCVCVSTYHYLLGTVIREVVGDDVSIGYKDIANCLGERKTYREKGIERKDVNNAS